MDIFNIYIKNLLGATVISNWRVRHLQAKSLAVYRVRSSVHYRNRLSLFKVKFGLQKIFDRHLTPVIKYLETQAGRIKLLPIFFFL